MRLILALLLLPGILQADCTNPAGQAGNMQFNTNFKTMQYCNGTNWINAGPAIATASQSGCTSPTGQAGNVLYNSSRGVIQFCNGSSWIDTACAADRNTGGSGCTNPAGQTGQMQYSGTAAELQFCDSTSWVAMGWPCSSLCYKLSGKWTSNSSTGEYMALGMSGDGTRIIAPNRAGSNVRVSLNGGTTWNASGSAGYYPQRAVISRDGTSMFFTTADPTSSYIFRSTDGGVNWSNLSGNSAALGTSNQRYYGVATSANGSKVILGKIGSAGSGPGIYTSADNGDTWTFRGMANYTWEKFAMSDDGTRIIAANSDNPSSSLIISTNSGASWVSATGAGIRRWSYQNLGGVAMSGNGMKIIAAPYSGYLYTSTDGGSTWTQRTALNEQWTGVAISQDGSIMAAVRGNAQGIYYSKDGGATWGTNQADSNYFTAFATNSTLTKIAGASYSASSLVSVSSCP